MGLRKPAIEDRVRFVIDALGMAADAARQQAREAETESEAAIFRVVGHIWDGAAEAVRAVLE